MVLRKLQIYGFKSFADRTEIEFGSGMTAVIGPNGCGKSNVVDAVRWVFGEQKASALRSTSMQDVIFSGTQRRQPLNMAEVTLVIENTRGLLPLEYREIAITRRVYRSGESEYLLNRTPCRLKDLQDMFLDTGVGSNAYTTIENNMINKILSDKAEERRILFEEAAGISKYKRRIRESQRKLDRTRQDLLRINDRLQEKERYVRMLARQVEKARRYQKYRDDLMGLELGLEYRRYRQLTERTTQRDRQLEQLRDELETVRAAIATDESRLEQMAIAKVEKENELQIAAKNVGDASERINGLDREISVSEQSLSFLHQNVDRFEQEMGSLEKQIEEKRELLTRIETSIVDRESQLAEHEERVGGAQAELAACESRMESHKDTVDELAQQQLNLVRAVGERQRSLSTCQTNLTNALERCERDEREIANCKTRIEEYREAVEQCQRQLEKESQEHANLLKSRESLWERIEAEEKRYHSLVEQEKRLEAQIDSGKAQLRFLEGLETSFEGYEAGTRALLTRKLPGTLGIVADLVRVESDTMVGLADRVLGSTVQTVVFERDADVERAVEFLAAEKAGTARLLSLERVDRNGTSVATPLEGAEPLRPHVRVTPEHEKLADHFFGPIQVATNGKVPDGIEPGGVVVSRSGVIRHGDGTVIAGESKKETVGILERKHQKEVLTADIARFEDEYAKIVHDKEICVITRDEAKRALVEVDEKLNRGRQRQQEQETTIAHHQNEINNIGDRCQALYPELARVRETITGYEEQIREHELALEEIAREREAIEAQIENAKARLEEMEQERAHCADHLKNVELSMHGLANRVEQDRHSVERLRKDVENFAFSRQRKIDDRNSAQGDIGELEKRIVDLKERLEAQRQERERLEGIHAEKRELYNGVLNQIEEVRKQMRQRQTEQETVSGKVHQLEVEQTRDAEQRRAIRERMVTSYEVDLEAPPENIEEFEGDDGEAIETIQMLKERLKRVGDVNMGAVSEYETENEELQQLVTQRDDLQTAVDDLERAIRKLNKEARNQFLQTFEEVKSNFSMMFTTLFEGGEAHIELEENADPLEAAISINARPAGKKMRGVSLLSGGERALTAISLLFALYMVKPSAYCILDELDAPLDEANIGRFVRILNKFAEKTQFIIITHSKRTMAAADILYGVTQEESGISTIASVKLAELDRKAA